MTIVRTKTPAGEDTVILPATEFERLLDLAEDASDARALQGSLDRLRASGEELLDLADLDALRAAPSQVAFWREKRGLTPNSLARLAEVDEAVVIALERGGSTGDIHLYRRLARVLGVAMEDIVPEPGAA